MLIKETLGCVKNFPKAIKWVHIIKMYHDKLKGGNLTMAKAENAEATNKTEKVAKATTKKATKEEKENAIKMIKAGKLSIDDIPEFFTSLTQEDIKEIEKELMQTV